MIDLAQVRFPSVYRRTPAGYVTLHKLAERAGLSVGFVKQVLHKRGIPGAVLAVGGQVKQPASSPSTTTTKKPSGGLKGRFVGSVAVGSVRATCWCLSEKDAQRWLAKHGLLPSGGLLEAYEIAERYGVNRAHFFANDLARLARKPIEAVKRDVENGELAAQRGVGSRPRYLISVVDGEAYLAKHGVKPGEPSATNAQHQRVKGSAGAKS